jgi:YhcN/YlaJ family sporulation lipoprotein
MKWIKNTALFLTFIMLIGVAISGCAVRRTPNPTPRQDINIPRTNTPDTNRNTVPDGNYSPGRLKTPVTTADNIAKAVQTVPGVKGASVVVSGNSAYVGINIDIKGNMDNTSKIQNLKKQTADMVRKTDSNIKTVYVSADADFIQRVSRIANDIRNGKPVEGFRDELDELVNRITPEKQ